MKTQTHLFLASQTAGGTQQHCTLLTKNTEPPPQPDGTGFLKRVFLATRIPVKKKIEKKNNFFLYIAISCCMWMGCVDTSFDSENHDFPPSIC